MNDFPWTESGEELLKLIKMEIQKHGGYACCRAEIMTEWKLMYLSEMDEAFKVLYYRKHTETLMQLFNIPRRRVYDYAHSLGLKRTKTMRRLLNKPNRTSIEVLDMEMGIYYGSIIEVCRLFNIKIGSAYNNQWMNERFFRI
jgi:hypothetical protein